MGPKVKNEAKLDKYDTSLKFHPISWQGLWNLFFRPSLYFRAGSSIENRWYQYMALIPYAMMMTKGNMVKKYILKFENLPDHPAHIVYNSWEYTWVILFFGGIIGAIFYWVIGVKYFDSRLKWCGVKNPDKNSARFIGIYSSLVYSLPGLLILFYESLGFDSIKEAINYPGIGWEFLTFQFMWWSCHVQWIGVKTRYQISGVKTFVWFYVFPYFIQFIYLHQKFYLRTIRDLIYQIIFFFEGVA